MNQSVHHNADINYCMQDLAGHLGIDASTIQLVSHASVYWPDTSLGCPQPGRMYAQVLTPGRHILLEVAGVQYSYHASKSGDFARCDVERAQKPLPGPSDI